MRNQDFDMNDYIKQRLTEIADTDEKRFAKEVLLKGLLSAFGVMEERYRELENRVKREMETENSRFVVFTTRIRRQDYDPTNRTWFPVCGQDVREGMTGCRRIYFQGNETEKREFERQTYLEAVDEAGEKHRVGIRRAEAYRKAVEALYRIFVYNRIPWNTVNTGELERFYELYPLDEDMDMEGWTVFYDSWQDKVCSDYIALWNIEKFYFHCMKFMIPCLDGKYYEHELNLEDYDADSGYMVENNEDILNIRYEKGKIVMTSAKETFEGWCAYRFEGKIDIDSYGYQHRIFGNRRKENFADCLAARYGQGLHTKTEIFRIVEGLDVGDYIRLTDCRIVDREEKGCYLADMNWFIQEELFPMETRRILELRFVIQTETEYYAEDMLRYTLSQIQLFLDEYKCVGVLDK